MTTKAKTTAKKAEEKKLANKMTNRYENLKANVAEITDLSFKVTEDSIEGILNTAGKIQQLSEKAAKGGMKIFDRQMDMLHSSVKTVKSKFTTESKRFKQVFSEN